MSELPRARAFLLRKRWFAGTLLALLVPLPAAAEELHSASAPAKEAIAESGPQEAAAPPHARASADGTAMVDAEAARDSSPAPEGEVSLVRRGSESCFVGAGTGAASIFLSSILEGGGLAAPNLFGLALSGAGFGCVIGFVGATAATGYTYLWEVGIDPYLPYLRGDAPAKPTGVADRAP